MIIKVKSVGVPIWASSFSLYSATNAKHDVAITCLIGSSVVDGSWFYLHGANNSPVYAVYYDVDSSGVVVSIAPDIQRIKVEVLSTDTAVQVATKTVTAINTIAGTVFTAANTGGTSATVDCECDDFGCTSDPVDGIVPTGFTFAQTTSGSVAVPANTLYEITGVIPLPGTYTEGNELKDFQYRTKPFSIIVPITEISYISQ